MHRARPHISLSKGEEGDGICTSCAGNKRFNPKYRIGRATTDAIAARRNALLVIVSSVVVPDGFSITGFLDGRLILM
jgi:hypothetical protein